MPAPKETHKTQINIPVGTIVGKNTAGAFEVIEILSKADTDKFWQEKFNKTPPHDQGYHIRLKCGKTYWTLKTQVHKCMKPEDVGWRTCYKCNKTCNDPCRFDQQISHKISVTPLRGTDLTTGQVFGDLKLVDFAFNTKRHNYYEFECINCGLHLFRMTPTNKSDIENCRCPSCNSTQYKGPSRIKEYLDKYNIHYQMEYKFNDCVYKSTLPFDFAIFYPTGQIKCLIEYDGQQHFEFVKIFHGDEEGFKLQQLRDSIKTKYCQEHDIKLIRIPYTEYNNIEEILKNNMII